MQNRLRKGYRTCLTVSLAALTVVCGCAATMSATGTNTGVFSYIRGELKRTYPASYEEAINACEASLAYLKMPREEFHQKGTTTVIRARRSDGTPVRVEVVSLSTKETGIGVRTGITGLWDRQTSELIHVTIAKHLP
ncbi:MAG: DUF3568 family protein [Desulfosarcinaceae bacterium]|jgi:hypothetical protein